MTYFFKLPPITDLTIGQQSALNDPNPIAVSGGPGTGKSVVSLWRHIRNYGLGSNKSLLLTYTKTLANYLSSSATSEDIEAGKAVKRTYWWTTHGLREYDEIIIDEAQDVEKDKYEIVKKYSKNISYGADDKQILYQHKCTTETELIKIFPHNQSYQLDENFRNSYEIMQFVKALFPSKLIPHNTIDNLLKENRRGNKPILLLTNNDRSKQDKAIIDIINQFKSETHNIAILVPLQRRVNELYDFIIRSGIDIKCSKFVSDDNELSTIENLHITTFKSSKGTEFDTVIIPDFQDYTWNITNLDKAPITENDYYVAATRVKRNLYMISSRSLDFLELSEQQKTTYVKELL